MRNPPGRPPVNLDTDALVALIIAGHDQAAACRLLGYIPRTFFHRKTTDALFRVAVNEARERHRLARPPRARRRYPEADNKRRRIRYANERPRPPGHYLPRSEDPADWTST